MYVISYMSEKSDKGLSHRLNLMSVDKNKYEGFVVLTIFALNS